MTVSLITGGAYVNSDDTALITVQFPNEAALPFPTGGKGFVVGVANIDGSGPGLAISTNNNWYLFKNDGNT